MGEVRFGLCSHKLGEAAFVEWVRFSLVHVLMHKIQLRLYLSDRLG